MTDFSPVSHRSPDPYRGEEEHQAKKAHSHQKEEHQAKKAHSHQNAETQVQLSAKDERTLEKIDDKIDNIINEIASKQKVNGDILNQVIRLLMQLIPVLQRIGTAQANQLSLPTHMQRLYTELIAKAPFYVKPGDPVPPGGISRRFDDDDSKDAQRRGEENSKVSNWIEQLRSFRDVWADNAKKLQTTLNTTNEAVNQQIDLLTTFLQQLRELVTLITKG